MNTQRYWRPTSAGNLRSVVDYAQHPVGKLFGDDVPEGKFCNQFWGVHLWANLVLGGTSYAGTPVHSIGVCRGPGSPRIQSFAQNPTVSRFPNSHFGLLDVGHLLLSLVAIKHKS